MSRHRHVLGSFSVISLVTSFVAALAACGGADPQPRSPGASASRCDASCRRSEAPAERAALGPMCDRYFALQRKCSGEYLPLLVDLRTELDMPRGIAARVKAEGRDAVIAAARAEWVEDSSPDAAAKMCQQIAERTPDDQVARLVRQGTECEKAAETSCDEFAMCAVQHQRSYIESGAQH